MTGKIYALDYEFNTGEMTKVIAVLDDYTEADLLCRNLSRSPDCFRVALYCLDVFDNNTLSSKLVDQYSSGFELSEALNIANKREAQKSRFICIDQLLF